MLVLQKQGKTTKEKKECLDTQTKEELINKCTYLLNLCKLPNFIVLSILHSERSNVITYMQR